MYIPTETLEGELAALRSHPVLAGFTSARVATTRSPSPHTVSLNGPGRGRPLAAPTEPSHVDLKALEPYLEDLARTSDGTGRSLARLGQLLVVLDMLAPAFAFPKPGQSLPATHPAVIAATEELDAAPDQAWTLADLAERAHVSPSYLCRLFMRELGISPLHYLERRRLELTAQLLLEGDLSINEIGSIAGWADANYMTRRFRSAQGMHPVVTGPFSKLRRCMQVSCCTTRNRSVVFRRRWTARARAGAWAVRDRSRQRPTRARCTTESASPRRPCSKSVVAPRRYLRSSYGANSMVRSTIRRTPSRSPRRAASPAHRSSRSSMDRRACCRGLSAQSS